MILSDLLTLRDACAHNSWNESTLRLARMAINESETRRLFWAALAKPENIQAFFDAGFLTTLQVSDPVVSLKLRLLLAAVKDQGRLCDHLLAGFAIQDEWQANVIVDMLKELPPDVIIGNAYACLQDSIARDILPIDSKDFGKVVALLVRAHSETDIDHRALARMCVGSDRRDRHYLSGFWVASELIQIRSRHAALIRVILAALSGSGEKIGSRDHKVHGGYSLSWRPVIRKDNANRDWEFNNVLVDILVELLGVNAAELSRVYGDALNFLGQSDSVLFRRIHLYLVSMYGSENEIRELMLKHEFFDDVLYRNEMANLFKRSFGILKQEEQERVLSWIDAGPREESSQAQSDQWKRNKLSWVESYLRPEQRTKYESLIRSRGVSTLADRASHHSISWGDPEAVTDRVSIKGLSIADAMARLSLGVTGNVHPSELRSEVASNVLAWTRALAAGPAIRENYAIEIFNALEKAIKDGMEIAWPELIQFIESKLTSDPGSDEARRLLCSISDIIAEGLKGAIPYAFYERIIAILKILIQYKPSGEAKADIVFEEHVSAALNTPEGRAASCVCQAIRWVISGEKINLAGERYEGGASRMRELTALVETHLSVESGPQAHPLYASYGLHTGLLRWIDLEWFTRLASSVLLLDDEHDHGDPAWGFWCAFLRYHHAHEEWFELFEINYRTTARYVATAGEIELSRNEAFRSYMEHIVSLAWQGHISTMANELLAQVFQATKRDLRWAGLSYMGRVLTDNKQAPPDEISSRFQGIWDWYWSLQGPADSAAHRAEQDRSHHPYGAWYASGVLDSAWSLDRLSQVLRESADLEPADDIMETLLKHFEGSERLTLSCVRMLVAGDVNGWKMYSWKDSLRMLLKRGIEQGGDVRDDALVIVRDVVLAGNVEFLDLIGQS